MGRSRLLLLILSTCAFFALNAGAASAALIFDGSPGTGPPPASLGPYSMAPFGSDPRGVFDIVSSVDDPAGSVDFSPALDHRRISDGWATWSHGYAGDVYATDGATSETLSIPGGTPAFAFYAEPNPFSIFYITAVAQDGTTSGPIAVDGLAGAQYFGFYGTGGDRVASITISSDVDFAVGEFSINGIASKKYVALGDSYSSGEGDPPFFAGTDGGGNFCHRSPQAYSEVLGAEFGATPLFYACSGAVTSDITSTFHMGEPPQLTRPGVDSSADLVTMTIGGNDAGFSDTLKSCIEQKLKADAFNAAIGPVANWLGFGKDPSCANSGDFTSSVDQRIDNVFWPVKSTYLAVKSATDPVNTSVMVADYPLLFPASHDDQGCLGLSIILTHDDMDWMNGEGGRLDGLLQQAAGEAGVNFVDVRGNFAGHEVCGPNGAYINGLSTASGNAGSCTWSVLGHCIIPGIPIVGSFHPNPSGHAFGYADAFASAITSAVETNPAGFPTNPLALPDPPSTTVVPAVGVGPLDAQPVPSTGGGGGPAVAAQAAAAQAAATGPTTPPDDCAGTYQAGQQVQFSADGFVPGASVQIYVTTPGASSNGELLLATVTADAAGHVSGTVRIPLTALGFTQNGAAAGNVFLDAIGLGTAINHLDAVAMLGLAPHSSECGHVETLPFGGFSAPVSNPPAVNSANSGRAIPVKFTVPGADGDLSQVLAAGYPQSAPVTCSAPEDVTTGDPTSSVGNPSGGGGEYHYNWKTDKSWHGCRSLILKLVDGSYHRAVFNFGK